jgi:hypothetical protein
VNDRAAAHLSKFGEVDPQLKRSGLQLLLKFAGEFTARVPPVPIPNTEVKPRWADGTARVSVWEIR